MAFDGATREKCTIQRQRTNTPLQALILLNSPSFVESSRALAASVLAKESSDLQRLRRLFRRVLSRLPEDDEVRVLSGLLERQRERFSATPDAVNALLEVGTVPSDGRFDRNELATWTVVVQTLLNLDEAITRR
jgi:hypothetical protein